MSEFYSFSGPYVRLAGNSPTELGTVGLAIHAPGNKSRFEYTIDTLVAGELPFVTIDERFLEAWLFEGSNPAFGVLGSEDPNTSFPFSARLGQIEWGSGLSSTVLAFEVTSGVITVRYIYTLDGDPLPLLGSTGAL